MADASDHEEDGLASQEAELSALDRDAQELARRGQARCRDEHCGKMVALPVKDKPHLAHALCKDHLTCNQTHTCQICKAWDQPIWDDFKKHLAHLAERRAADKLRRDRERERKSKEQRSEGDESDRPSSRSGSSSKKSSHRSKRKRSKSSSRSHSSSPPPLTRAIKVASVVVSKLREPQAKSPARPLQTSTPEDSGFQPSGEVGTPVQTPQAEISAVSRGTGTPVSGSQGSVDPDYPDPSQRPGSQFRTPPPRIPGPLAAAQTLSGHEIPVVPLSGTPALGSFTPRQNPNPWGQGGYQSYPGQDFHSGYSTPRSQDQYDYDQYGRYRGTPRQPLELPYRDYGWGARFPAPDPPGFQPAMRPRPPAPQPQPAPVPAPTPQVDMSAQLEAMSKKLEEQLKAWQTAMEARLQPAQVPVAPVPTVVAPVPTVVAPVATCSKPVAPPTLPPQRKKRSSDTSVAPPSKRKPPPSPEPQAAEIVIQQLEEETFPLEGEEEGGGE